ncbi:GspJ family T2SS minor pseudopilin variant LspJ [Legionella longbeachae]|uniref:Type II secretion system protein J n=1 Tax=Legionella longbeachae serogroup 1 (strain NSW150) TaxID=661367 RepID=D3HSC3_LEGLN|nr:GspJ family T2SS minor pseudopilin variant LspJ [Legionella longbeachae]VEE02307.1 type II secretory pathway protein LspJ [Legionella oakridgensis]HBD7398201.1 GspJ family T2SS minor pseudopilin variant LspJ [Legionella pneumophila]ARB91404.1 type II secretion system protein GspJ [Legionella longbeachae]ARM32169.1 type II secretion system protein GspJ [Legionella longbeachae]EEZ95052.1 type II secretory pathway protein LspJ [Legionella longbeachae D-4968]
MKKTLKKQNKIRGFTLIEILIALAVFAILATITTSVLYNAFTTRSRVNEQSTRLNELQLAISLIQQDTSQVIERAIRGNEMRLFSAFIGQTNYLEFTRDGVVNPGSIEKRSTLKRVAYICQEGTLIRRSWNTLDSLNRNAYDDKPLLSQLTDCHFGYLNQNLQILPEWREQAVGLNQHKEPFPKAIQVNLTLHDQGEINLLFTLPGALYAQS